MLPTENLLVSLVWLVCLNRFTCLSGLDGSTCSTGSTCLNQLAGLIGLFESALV